jgi:serine/threonine protein kinase/lipoprotein NlpI
MPVTYSVGDQPVPGAGYKLARFLGRGGFGEVWQATAPGGAEAAVKIIRLGSREGRKELRALQLVKRIHHTHLVPIIAFWIKNDKGDVLDDEAVLQADQRDTAPAVVRTVGFDTAVATAALDSPAELIIAMGLGERSLFDRLEQCRNEGLSGIPDEELLGYLEDSAAAIDFLNSPVHDLGSGPAGIQHCDIKPHNLVLVGGSVQVCDFGLARMMGADRATTAAASIAYAAPECLVRGKPSDSTDQYCLAVSFVELKTGQLPYCDLTMAAVMEAKRNDNLDLSMLPEAVRPVVRRATNSDPAKRFGSCREMVRELRRALSGQGGPAARVPEKSGRRLLAAALAVVVLAIATSGALWAWQKYRPTPAAGPLVVRPPDKQPSRDSGGADVVGPVTKPETTPDVKPVADPVVKPVAKPADTASGATIRPNNTASDREADALLESGKTALTAGNFAAAVADLEKAAKLRPRDARVYSRLGAAWMGQEKWEKAIGCYTTAIEINPFDNDHLMRGRANMELNATDRAIEDFTAATRLNPHNAAAFVALGGAFLDKDDPARAVAAYDEAVNICAGDPKANFPLLNARVDRANANIMLGNKAAAADDLTRVIPHLHGDPQSAQSVFDAAAALAKAYAKAGQYADAAKWADKSAGLAPDAASKEECGRLLRQYKAKQ